MVPNLNDDYSNTKMGTSPSQARRKRMHKPEKWELIKDEVYQVYIDEDHTLSETRNLIQQKHRFTASERTWKSKIKAWGFDKNVPGADMAIIVAKAEKRAADGGKQTVFFHHGSQVEAEKIERFKKRKISKDLVASPNADTPCHIRYHTPGAEAIAAEFDVHSLLSGLGLDEHSTSNNSSNSARQVLDILETGVDDNRQDGLCYTRYDETAKELLLNVEMFSPLRMELDLAADGNKPSIHLLQGGHLQSTEKYWLGLHLKVDRLVRYCIQTFFTLPNHHEISTDGLFAAFQSAEIGIQGGFCGLLHPYAWPCLTREVREGTNCFNIYLLKISYEEDELINWPCISRLQEESKDEILCSWPRWRLARLLCALALTLKLGNQDILAKHCCHQAIAFYDSVDEHSLEDEDKANLANAEQFVVRILQLQENSTETQIHVLQRIGVTILRGRWAQEERVANLLEPLMEQCKYEKTDMTNKHIRENLSKLRKSMASVCGSPINNEIAYRCYLYLGDSYSTAKKFTIADAIFELFLKESRMDPRAPLVQYAYSLHCARQGKLTESLKAIKCGFELLALMYPRYVDTKPFNSALLYDLLSKSKTRVQSREDSSPDDRSVLEQVNAAQSEYLRICSEYAQQLQDRERLFREKLKSNEQSGSTPSPELPNSPSHRKSLAGTRSIASENAPFSNTSASYKYGVTYSVSNITGISDSEFMVP